jgi:hypothetical protein
MRSRKQIKTERDLFHFGDHTYCRVSGWIGLKCVVELGDTFEEAEKQFDQKLKDLELRGSCQRLSLR